MYTSLSTIHCSLASYGSQSCELFIPMKGASETQLWHMLPCTTLIRKSVKQLICWTTHFIAVIDVHPSTDIETQVATQSKIVYRNIQSFACATMSLEAYMSRVVTDLQCLITKSIH